MQRSEFWASWAECFKPDRRFGPGVEDEEPFVLTLGPGAATVVGTKVRRPREAPAKPDARLLRMQSTGCLDRTSKHFTTQPRRDIAPIRQPLSARQVSGPSAAANDPQVRVAVRPVQVCAPLSARSGCGMRGMPVAGTTLRACTHRAAPVRQQTMPVFSCSAPRAPAVSAPSNSSNGSKLWDASLSKELDSRYPSRLLVNDIITELLDSRPQPLTAPELRKNLKPRLVALILDSIAAEGLQTNGSQRSVRETERAMLAVVFHNAEVWQEVCGATRRQCSACGIPHYLAARILESLRAFLGLPELSEDGDSDAWAPPPEQPLHHIDDVPPLLSTRGRWQEEQLPAGFSLQEPVTFQERSDGGPAVVSPMSLDLSWELPERPADASGSATLPLL